MSQNVSHVKYNLLNLPDSVFLPTGICSASSTWRTGGAWSRTDPLTKTYK